MRHYTINANCNWILTDSGDAVGFSYNTPVVARIGGKFFRTNKKMVGYHVKTYRKTIL